MNSFEKGIRKNMKWALDKAYRRNVLYGETESNSTRQARIEKDLRIIDAQAKRNNESKTRSVIRYSHNYKWFGFCKKLEDSIKIYRIAAKCIDLEELRYQCYAPDPDYDDCCVYFETTEEDIEKKQKKHPQLRNFIVESGISLVDFLFMEIIDKIYYLSEYFDLVEFMGLKGEEGDAIPIDDVIETII